MDYDLIVIGLGPAGSVAARNASRLGLRVLAFDRSLFPRSKVCGGGLSPRVRSFFDGGTIPSVETVVTELGLSFKGNNSHVSFEDPIAYLVCRDRFDHALLMEAEKAGTRIITGERALSITETAEHFSVFTEKNEYRARTGIGADGALGITSRHLNPLNIRKGYPGIEGEFPLPAMKAESRIEIDVGVSPGGYGWIFPKGRRTSIGVAAMVQGKEIRKQFLDYAGELNKTSDSPLQGEGHPLPLWRKNGAWNVHSNRSLLAG